MGRNVLPEQRGPSLASAQHGARGLPPVPLGPHLDWAPGVWGSPVAGPLRCSLRARPLQPGSGSITSFCIEAEVIAVKGLARIPRRGHQLRDPC